MKLKTHGFYLFVNGTKSIDDVCEYIASLSAEPHGPFFVPMVRSHRDARFWIGVMLKPKNMKAFCKIRIDNNDNYEVEPENLQIGEQLVDFNHFIINCENGKGLYQSYYNSTSMSTFATFLKYAHARFEHGINIELDPTRRQNLSDYGENVLSYVMRINHSELPGFLSELSRIKEIEFGYGTHMPSGHNPYQGFSGEIRDRIEVLKFNNRVIDIDGIKRNVANYINRHRTNLKKVVITGIDPQEQERIFNLANPKDYTIFEERNYHEVVRLIRYDSTNLISALENSFSIQGLIRIAQTSGRDFID